MNYQDYCRDLDCVAEYFYILGATQKSLYEREELGEGLQPKILYQFPPVAKPDLGLQDSFETVNFI